MTSTESTDATYLDVASVIESLPLLIRHTRRARRLSLRAAAAQIGCDNSTLYRIESGENYTAGTIPAILRWMDQSGG